VGRFFEEMVCSQLSLAKISEKLALRVST